MRRVGYRACLCVWPWLNGEDWARNAAGTMSFGPIFVSNALSALTFNSLHLGSVRICTHRRQSIMHYHSPFAIFPYIRPRAVARVHKGQHNLAPGTYIFPCLLLPPACTPTWLRRSHPLFPSYFCAITYILSSLEWSPLLVAQLIFEF